MKVHIEYFSYTYVQYYYLAVKIAEVGTAFMEDIE